MRPLRLDPDIARRWSQLHSGIDPTSVPLLAGWLTGVHAAARPLRRVPPSAITAAGAAFAVAAVPLAARDRARWRPAAAVGAVLAAVACDALDGAVALQADRATPTGAVLDRTADRVSDAAFAAVMWRLGAPAWLAGAAGTVAFGIEISREVEGGALRSTVTVAERPTRTICAAFAGAAAAVVPARWPATVCAAVALAASLTGAGQLAAASRRARPRPAFPAS